MADETVLKLYGMGVPPYSARGLAETLAPIAQAFQARRTVNGSLKDISATQFQKYAGSISGADQRPPACDGVWPGRILTIEPISELAFETATAGPQRTPVPGSEREDEDGFTYYRPVLEVMVTGWQQQTAEWTAGVAWQLDFEEV